MPIKVYCNILHENYRDKGPFAASNRMVNTNIIQSFFHTKGIQWPMDISEFDPSIFDDIFSIVSGFTFEVIFENCKDHSADVVYYRR